MTIRLPACLFVCVVAMTASAGAQTTLMRSVLANGAAEMGNGSYRVAATVGQTVVGPVRSPNRITGQGFWYRVHSIPTTAGDAPLPPSDIILHQNYPNPFNPSTVISFQLPVRAHVRMQLYRPSGRLLAVLVDKTLPSGMHRVQFEADGLPAGMYVCRLICGEKHAVRKMLLMK